MLAGLEMPPAVEAERVITAVLANLRFRDRCRVVVVSSREAGKSALVVCAAVERLIVIAQTNEQVDDLTDRLAQKLSELCIGRLSAAADYRKSERVKGQEMVWVGVKVTDLGVRAVTVGTIAKSATVTDCSWVGIIVDEAYQMRSNALLRAAGRFEPALFVVDPGQLDGLSTVETVRWTGLTGDPMQIAVAVLLRHNPDLPVHRLLVSRRAPERSVDS
ncbi:hypothetical protein [Micromonospora sp. NBC_01638]|uniref:hypothetical protein n=1 Tax=Micromonospora sp. NBC_01638 TaxID=2975982 RepID=UPI00386F3D1A